MMDFVQSVPGEDPLVVEGYFAVSPDRMFEAWTVPSIVQQWFGRTRDPLHSAEIDLAVGGAWRFILASDDEKTTGFEGEYLDIVPDAKLVFSWCHVTEHASGEREASPVSRVEVTFTPKGVGTQVLVVHSGISNADARKGIGGGWSSSFTKISEQIV